MNEAKTIKKILELGFKEYKPNYIGTFERAWQKEIEDDFFIDIRFWEHSKIFEGIDNFDIKIYKDSDTTTEQINIHSFKTIEIGYKRALEYIKFLK